MSLKGESCVYYPCDRAKKIGITACFGCSRYIKRNPEQSDEFKIVDDGR